MKRDVKKQGENFQSNLKSDREKNVSSVNDFIDEGGIEENLEVLDHADYNGFIKEDTIKVKRNIIKLKKFEN